MLLQLGITYDELVRSFSYFPQSNNSIKLGSTISTDPSLNAIRVIRNVNLPAGRYKCTIAGLDVASGDISRVTFNFPSQIFELRSPQITREGGQNTGILFTNNNQYTLQDTGGDRIFYIQLTANWIELNLSLVQYDSQFINPDAPWSESGFAFFLLTLDVQLEDMKALYGTK
jgi:hypothetical protein